MAGVISPDSMDESRVFISAGEASGDALGGALTAALKQLDSTLRFEAIGGVSLANQGVQIVANSKNWGAISVLESLHVAPRVIQGFRKAKRALQQGDPGLLIAIDFGFVNVRLIQFAKALGWKTLYFMPPGSWNRAKFEALQTENQAHLPRYAAFSDAIVTPFEWSYHFLQKCGTNAYWFGHPLKQLLGNALIPRLEDRTAGVAFLPGSRDHELKINLPIFASLAKNCPSSTLVVAPNLNFNRIESAWRKQLPNPDQHQVVQGFAIQVLSSASAAVVCSGTAALEAALCQCPHLVMYKFSKQALLEARLLGFKKPQFIGLGNIILGRLAFPEYVQDDATEHALTQGLDQLLTDHQERQSQLKACQEVMAALGGNQAINQTAELAYNLLKGVASPTR